ncbi:MAG: DUF4345 family protein [Gammaproteobacteria bacterium]|nr:DUF4345 family protein [Gammaproteobacteria bacterium]
MSSPTKFAKRYLQLMGLLFLVYGLGYTFFPLNLSEVVTGGILTTPSSVTHVRATDGGLNIGLGLWLFICARRNVRLGALGLMVVLASTIASRGVGVFLENHSNAYMYIFLAIESYLLATALAVWYKVK